MREILLLAVLLLCVQTRLVNHLETSYQTCCPDTYVLQPK